MSLTALQALACFLVQLLAEFETSYFRGAKKEREKIYNDFDFDSLKETFCGIEWTAKKSFFSYFKNSPKWPKSSYFCNKKSAVFFFLSETWIIYLQFFSCISCITMLLFSHQYLLLQYSYEDIFETLEKQIVTIKSVIQIEKLRNHIKSKHFSPGGKICNGAIAPKCYTCVYMYNIALYANKFVVDEKKMF